MENELKKVDVREEDLLQVNGGAEVEFYFCLNPECVNNNIYMSHNGHCPVCGGPMMIGSASFASLKTATPD